MWFDRGLSLRGCRGIKAPAFPAGGTEGWKIAMVVNVMNQYIYVLCSLLLLSTWHLNWHFHRDLASFFKGQRQIKRIANFEILLDFQQHNMEAAWF